MEPVDGVETTRRIRGRYDDVAVVVLTSYGEGRHVRSALDAGASGYLLKDADADEVAASLRAAHRGELQLDAAVTRSLVGAPQGGTSNPAAALTSRELEVLGLVGAGNANKAIARELADHRADDAVACVEHPREARPQLSYSACALGRAKRPRVRRTTPRTTLRPCPPETSAIPTWFASGGAGTHHGAEERHREDT